MARLIKPSRGEKVKNFPGGALTVRPLKNVKYTGKLMRELSIRYQGDVAEFGHLSLLQFYDKIKNIPYKQDPKKQEFLQRPYYTLNQRGKGGDCDDKCICLGAYCALAKIPFRFVALGKTPKGRLHHVIIEVLIGNHRGELRWIHLDCTYSFNVAGKQMYHYPRSMVISEPYPAMKAVA